MSDFTMRNSMDSQEVAAGMTCAPATIPPIRPLGVPARLPRLRLGQRRFTHAEGAPPPVKWGLPYAPRPAGFFRPGPDARNGVPAIAHENSGSGFARGLRP